MRRQDESLTASKRASQEPFLRLMRELALTYQSLTALDAGMLRQHELTPAQADVIFTLGNTPGMTLGELGERTLITKGTLTGVVDRLEAKGLVRRQAAPHDGRCILAVLTTSGDELFQRVFPAHIGALKERFSKLSATDRDAAIAALRKVRAIL